MKDIIKDFKDENFTKRDILVYGIGYPLFIAAACFVAEWINAL